MSLFGTKIQNTTGLITGSVGGNLVANCPMKNNANDVSGNGNNGTVSGATLIADRFGIANSAYSNDGIDDSIGFSNTLYNGLTDKSFCAWLNVTTTPSVIYRKWASGAEDKILVVDASVVTIGEYPTTTINFNCACPTGVWFHLCYTSSGTSKKLYINGRWVGTVTRAGVPADSTGIFTIAADNQGGYYNFDIAKVKIYNKALNSFEIKQLYYEGN